MKTAKHFKKRLKKTQSYCVHGLDNMNRLLWTILLFGQYYNWLCSVIMFILPKAIYRFNTIPIKISMICFKEIEQKVIRFCNHKKDPEQPKQSWGGEKNERSWRYHTLWLQIILQGNNNWKNMVWGGKKHRDDWNRIESPLINPHVYGWINLDKGAKNIQWKKKPSSVNGAGKIGKLRVKEWN